MDFRNQEKSKNLRKESKKCFSFLVPTCIGKGKQTAESNAYFVNKVSIWSSLLTALQAASNQDSLKDDQEPPAEDSAPGNWVSLHMPEL